MAIDNAALKLCSLVDRRNRMGRSYVDVAVVQQCDRDDPYWPRSSMVGRRKMNNWEEEERSTAAGLVQFRRKAHPKCPFVGADWHRCPLRRRRRRRYLLSERTKTETKKRKKNQGLVQLFPRAVQLTKDNESLPFPLLL